RRPSSVFCHPKVGYPIRKSADQSFFAAPRGLSQRSTSFIASQRQGIHRMPLRHLIVLIINTHSRNQKSVVSNQIRLLRRFPSRISIDFSYSRLNGSISNRFLITDYCSLNSWNRKTSLLRDRSNGARGQRRRQQRHSHPITASPCQDCTAT